MKRIMMMAAALTFTMALYVPLAPARTTSLGSAVQDPSPEEAAAYKAWYDANAAKDYPKAMELAKAYLEKFPSGNAKNIDYLKNKWIPQMRGYFFAEAAKAKNVAEIIRIGKEVLASDPENLDYASAVVVQIRTIELSANPPNYSHAADAADFAEKSIKLIEAGKTAGDPKAFKKEVTLGYLHETLAKIYEGRDKNADKALAEYEKAGEIDSSNAGYFFTCGRIHNDKYAAAAQKYQAIPEAERTAAEPKPEVKAALDELNKQADAVINCWARYMGLTADKKDVSPQLRAQIEKALTELYKYRHNDSTEGLQKLIDQYKPSPQSNSAAMAAPGAKP